MSDGLLAPRVRRLVVFKHGVAYLERGGPADGAFELSFRRDEMNDVLKSLAVWIAEGEGTIGAATFEAPDDPAEALSERGLLFDAGASFRGLVHALRGRTVTLDVGGTAFRGEVIGAERDQDREGRTRERLLVRDEEGRVALHDAGLIRSISLEEGTSRADLSWLIDKSRAANDREHRRVRIDLRGSVADLRVAYTVPAPIWRVSYRIILEDEEATLMAWAIVHNPADEDLEDIQLTLTTGQPVSFVTELYEPRNVQRARLEEATRAVAAPRKMERSRKKMAKGGAPPPPMPRAAPAPQAMAASVGAGSGAPGFGGGVTAVDGFAGDVESGDRSEHFEYRVGAPVTLRRGGSAMVPILSSKLPAKRERIWRDGQGPAPDIVIHFDNGSDAVLEEGPAVIYDDGGYAGEAMVPYSTRGAEIRLPFARDLGVRCSRSAENVVRLDGIRIKGLIAWERHIRRDTHTLVVENDHDEAMTVFFEIPRKPDREIEKGGLEPAEVTSSYWRFAVEAPAKSTAEATFVERWQHHYRLETERLDMARLETWFAADAVDPTTSGTLRGVMDTWQRASDLDAEANTLAAELATLQAHAENLKGQLGVLGVDGEEGALRMRWVHELGQTIDRQKEIWAEQKRLGAEAEGLRARAREVLENIDVGE